MRSLGHWTWMRKESLKLKDMSLETFKTEKQREKRTEYLKNPPLETATQHVFAARRE
jgi:hypothetical protein